MNTAFEITPDDVTTVAQSRMGVRLAEDAAEKIFDSLDKDAVEAAALCGNDLDEQATYAYDEIEKQIRTQLVASRATDRDAARGRGR